MNYEEYKAIAGQAIVQATYIFDLSRSAEHLITHPSRRNSEERPRFCFDELGTAIFGSVYVRVSLEMNAAINIKEVGSPYLPPETQAGNLMLDLSLLPALEGSRVTPFVARLSIIEQYELLKRFLHQEGAPFNEKRARASQGIYSKEFLDGICQLADRRNQLAHEILAPQATMRNAIEYCYTCLEMARLVQTKEVLTR